MLHLIMLSEDPRVAATASFVLERLVRRLLMLNNAEAACPLVELETVLADVQFAAQQVRVAQSASIDSAVTANDRFAFKQLLSRQHRWFEHTPAGELRRDAVNRFVPKSSFPFPFSLGLSVFFSFSPLSPLFSFFPFLFFSFFLPFLSPGAGLVRSAFSAK